VAVVLVLVLVRLLRCRARRQRDEQDGSRQRGADLTDESIRWCHIILLFGWIRRWNAAAASVDQLEGHPLLTRAGPYIEHHGACQCRRDATGRLSLLIVGVDEAT